jgi:hypothetical protein
MTLAAPPPAGYSGTPLARKLGIVAGARVCVQDAPADLPAWLAPLPEGVRFTAQADAQTDTVLLFCHRREVLHAALQHHRQALRADAALWVCWPKKAAKLPTDITEDTVRALALPLGWVDTKVCAVSAVWSGLKLVVRKALR